MKKLRSDPDSYIYNVGQEFYFLNGAAYSKKFESTDALIVKVVVAMTYGRYFGDRGNSCAVTPAYNIHFIPELKNEYGYRNAILIDENCTLYCNDTEPECIFTRDFSYKLLYKTLEEAKEAYKLILLKQYELKVLEIDNLLI